MIQSILQFYLKLVIFATTLILGHYTLHYFEFWKLSTIEFKRIHGFNLMASVFFQPLLAYAFVFLKDKAGFIFLALNTFKMLLAMTFMAILILVNKSATQSFALQFIVVYFAYMTFDLILAVKKLKS